MKKLNKHLILLIILQILNILFIVKLSYGQNNDHSIIIYAKDKIFTLSCESSISELYKSNIIKRFNTTPENHNPSFLFDNKLLTHLTKTNIWSTKNELLTIFDTGPFMVDYQQWIPSNNNALLPRSASSGDSYIVVWYETDFEGNYFLNANRISSDGSLLDIEPILLPTASYDYDVAYGDGVYLVIWTYGPSDYKGIYGARITPEGTLLDPNGFSISTANENRGDLSIAYGNGGFLAVWTDYRLDPSIAFSK